MTTRTVMANRQDRLTGAGWLLTVYLLLSIAGATPGAARVSRQTARGGAASPDDEPTDTLDEMAKLLGVRRVPVHLRHHAPPDYLRQL